MQRLLSLCGLVLGAVAHHGVALGQVEVERDERAVLHAQGPQSGAVDLRGNGERGPSLVLPCVLPALEVARGETYLRCEVPQHQPAAGPAGAVGAPGGSLCTGRAQACYVTSGARRTQRPRESFHCVSSQNGATRFSPGRKTSESQFSRACAHTPADVNVATPVNLSAAPLGGNGGGGGERASFTRGFCAGCRPPVKLSDTPSPHCVFLAV